MLSWSAETTKRQVDIRGVADPAVDPLVHGGRQLAALGRTAGAIRSPDASATIAVANELGAQPATDAAAVATAFEGLNRIVDGVGLPIARASRRDMKDVIETLGLDAFPHADHS